MRQERISAKDYRAMVEGGPKGASRRNKRVEGDLSKAIAEDLTLVKKIINERLQSGSLKVVKERITRSGERRRYEGFVKFCTEGTPDRVAFNGVTIFFEVKKKGETSSPKQRERQAELRRAGAVVVEIDCFEDYERAMRVVAGYATQIACVQILAAEIDRKIAEAIGK